MSKYDDIINLPHHRSKTHPHASLHDRAAQFAPFSALTGYDEAIFETARFTYERPQLDEQQLALMNERLLRIKNNPNASVRVIYFVADEKKEGGRFEEAKSTIRKIDDVTKRIILESGEIIPLDDIMELHELSDCTP